MGCPFFWAGGMAQHFGQLHLHAAWQAQHGAAWRSTSDMSSLCLCTVKRGVKWWQRANFVACMACMDIYSICSMYGVFTNIGPKNHPNVGKCHTWSLWVCHFCEMPWKVAEALRARGLNLEDSWGMLVLFELVAKRFNFVDTKSEHVRKPRTPQTLQFTSYYTSHSALSILHFALYTIHSTLYNWPCRLYPLHSTLHTALRHSLHLAPQNLHSTLHTTRFPLRAIHFLHPGGASCTKNLINHIPDSRVCVHCSCTK